MRVQTRQAMGTLVEISLARLPAAAAARASHFFDAAFARISRLEKILTCHDDSAPLGRLRRAGRLENPPPELEETLRAALEHARLSGGAFNPAVKPLLDMLRENPGGDPVDFEPARRLLSWEAVRIDSGGITLGVRGMALTLDALAKGFIVDCASAELLALGAENHLINAGGDILARGARPDGSPWRSGIADPRGPGALLAAISLRDQAVATSGNSESLKEGYKHLVPPAGRAETENRALPLSASAIAPRARDADALATTLAVMPAELGPEHVERFEGAACLLLTSDGGLIKSRRWPQSL